MVWEGQSAVASGASEEFTPRGFAGGLACVHVMSVLPGRASGGRHGAGTPCGCAWACGRRTRGVGG